MLEEYDHNKTNYTSSLWVSHGNEDPQGDGEDLREERQIAFGTDACKFQDDKYWVNFLADQSKLRKLERGQQRSLSTSLKRRASGTTEHLAVEDEGHRSQSSIPELKRRRVHAHGSSHRPSTPARHQRRQNSVTRAIELSGNEGEGETVLENEIAAVTTFPGNPHRVTQSVETSTRFAKSPRYTLSLPPARLGLDQCELILPHGEDKYLVINKDIIPKCSYLSTRNPSSSSSSSNMTQLDLTHDQRANDVQLAATDFSAVLQFYQTGDIGPRFIINNNKPLQFSPLDLSPDQKASHVESLAKAYVTAVKIQDENLQHLIFQKLQLLGSYSTSSSFSSSSFSSLSILILASCFSHLAALKTTTAHIEKDATDDDNDDEISLWVLDLVKNHYWLLVRNHIDELQNILEHNHSMRRAVYDFLRGNPLGGREG